MKSDAAQLEGQRFGMLLVKERAGSKVQGRAYHALWLCVCSCKNTCIKTTGYLVSNQKKGSICNCGCSTNRIRSLKMAGQGLMNGLFPKGQR